MRPLHGDDRPLLGGRRQPHGELRPFRLAVVLHHVEYARRTAGRRRHVETIRGRARDHAVVVDESILAQQDSVACAADSKIRPVVDVQAVQELGRIGADDRDLAECRGVEDSAAGADRQAFAGNGRMHVLARARKIPRALPQADILEHGAMLRRPFMHRRLAHRIEQLATRHASERPEGHRRVRHPERGQPDFRNALAELPCDDAERIQVRCLALVGCHADGRIALDVLDGTEALA